MSYNTQSLLVSWHFSIVGTDEEAVTSLHFSAPGGGGYLAQDDVTVSSDADLNALGSAMETLLSSAEIEWANYSKLTGVRLAGIRTDGSYTGEPRVWNAPGLVTGNATNVPPQCTVVLSMRSGGKFGQANYGRMYLPHTHTLQISGTPYGAPGYTDAIAAHGKTFVESCRTIVSSFADATIRPCIMSKVGAGFTKEVLEVACGNVTDTQRRRRNRLQEIYAYRLLA